MESSWHQVKSMIKTRIPGHMYRMWIDPVRLQGTSGDDVTLSCANPFSQKRVRDHYGAMIENAFQEVCGRKITLSYSLSESAQGPVAETPVTPEPERQLSLPTERPKVNTGRVMRGTYTFDRFVVDGSNDFAYTAALSLAANKNHNHQNSLFLLSETGMGKSHLSQAVGHQIVNAYPGERVYYVSAEDFASEMFSAIQTDSLPSFKDKYRKNCDVLLMEDVHQLSGKKRTQSELSQILDYLFEANKKIIFSSCYLPSEIPKLNDQLNSRLSSGLISKIDAPQFKTRVKILKKKSQDFGYNIPIEVSEYMADALTDNIRQLESGLISVGTKAALLGQNIDLALAESIVRTMITEKKRISVELIKDLVAQAFSISKEEMLSKSRRQAIVKPRQVAMYLSRRYTDHSLQSIGRSFNRYHATAIHAINSVEKGLKSNQPISRQVDILSRQIESGKF